MRHRGQWAGVWGARAWRQVKKEEVILGGPCRVRWSELGAEAGWLWAEGATHTSGVCMQNMANGDPRKENGATS